MYIYVYTFICIFMPMRYTYIYIYVYTYRYMHAYIPICICIYTYTSWWDPCARCCYSTNHETSRFHLPSQSEWPVITPSFKCTLRGVRKSTQTSELICSNSLMTCVFVLAEALSYVQLQLVICVVFKVLNE